MEVHQHHWLMWAPNGQKPEIIANSSCPVCGLTPEAVANEAAIKTLLAERDRLRDRCREYRRQLELLGISVIEED